MTKVRNLLARALRLRGIKRQRKPAFCISHLEGADYVNVLSKAGEKTVICVHGSKLHDPSMIGLSGVLRQKMLIPWLYNRADAIVTVSRDIAAELVALGVHPAKVRTINNFFGVAEIQQAAAEPLDEQEQAINDSGPVLVTSGRLAPQKNQAPLLRIFAELRRARPDVKLLILGDGELRDDLLATSRSLGLSTYAVWDGGALSPDCDIYFLGMKDNPFKYIRPADLFVFPSEWEGCPMALGEAMVCGAPVVTTDCRTGPREILAPATPLPERPIMAAELGEFGMLMPVLHRPEMLAHSRQIWVSTLMQLLDDSAERQRLGRLGSERMQDFSRGKISGRWLALIDELLQQPSASPQ